jgi:hypothetical protein
VPWTGIQQDVNGRVEGLTRASAAKRQKEGHLTNEKIQSRYSDISERSPPDQIAHCHEEGEPLDLSPLASTGIPAKRHGHLFDCSRGALRFGVDEVRKAELGLSAC